MKDKILDKAGKMFLTLGFKSVTMDDIAREMGMSKKTLYKYYPNKAGLVSESTMSVQKEINDTISHIKEQNYNAIEEEFAVKAIFKEMLKNAKTSPMFQLKKYYPETYEELMSRDLCMFKDCNTDNLKKGIAQGLYRADINIEHVVNFYFTLIYGVFESDMYGSQVSELMKLEYEVLEYHIRAIATEKGLKELEKQIENNQ